MNLPRDEFDRRRKPRAVQGISAVLMPYQSSGKMDEAGFHGHLRRTLAAGLRLAVNMDTGYVDLLKPEENVGVRLTSGFLLEPEQSTSAIVVHHPGAKYFVV